MSNILKKINRKKIKQDNKKDAIQLKNLISKKQKQDDDLYSLIGASDEDIDKYFDDYYDENIYHQIHTIKSKHHTKPTLTKKHNEQILKDIEEHEYNMVSSGDYFYDTKKYILSSELLSDGSKMYFFNIFDTEPYLRRTKQDRLGFKPNKNYNKIVFDILKKKNLYYLKKPFEELLQYIHLMSLKIIMTVIFSNDRLYIRSCIEFYLEKYQIYFKRYVDNSNNRVKKHRLKI